MAASLPQARAPWFVLPLLLSASALLTQPRDLRFERLSVEHGLSNFTVTSIVQDHEGFLWFGTADGLNKYDGYDFKIYKHDPSDTTGLPGQEVTCLLLDRAGTLWLGAGLAGKGLYRYDPEGDRFVRLLSKAPLADRLAGHVIGMLHEDGRGEFWLATSGGLFHYNLATDSLWHYRHDAAEATSLDSDVVTAIGEDHAGEIWIATGAGGMNRWERGTARFKHYPIVSPATGREIVVRKILADRRGMMWIATTAGLYRYDHATEKITPCPTRPEDPHGIVFDHVVTLYEDTRGRIWIGLFGNGLWRYEAESERFFPSAHDPSDPHSLSSNRIENIFEDRSGILWFATYRNGLNRYNRRQEAFARYPSAHAVYAVAEDGRGEVLLGTFFGGLLHYDRAGNLLRITRRDPQNPHSLGSDYVMAIHADSTEPGDLWIGTDLGLNRYEAKRDRFVRFDHGKYDPARPEKMHVKTIFADTTGNLLLGTKGDGLLRLNRGAMRLQQELPDLRDENIWCLAQGREGASVLWQGTFGNGVFRFDRSTRNVKHYYNASPDSSRLSSNVVYAIYADTAGYIWIATTSGLNCLDTKTGRVRYWKDRDGLPDNFVKGILPDDRGNLWLSTDNGLTRFNPRTEKFKNYTVKEGLLHNTFLSGAYFKACDGRLYFGSEAGAIAFHPDSLRENMRPPQVTLTAFKIFDQPARLPRAAPHRLRLSYQQNFFSFEFVALDFNNPAKHQYAYMLKGFDRDWVQAGARRYASYTNVHPGEYVFRVKGSNSDGVWNEEGASVHIVIAPPFWQTWWFRSLAIFVAGAAVFGVYRYRVSRLLERTRLAAHLQAARETERTHLAREIHDELGQYLTGLKMDVAFMENMISAQNGETERAALFNKVQAMSGLLDTTVKTVRKISTELRPAVLDSMGLLAAIEWLAEEFQKRSGIACACYLTASEVRLDRDRATAVFRIVQESLTNVLRHAQATRATITFENDKGGYWLEVKDNGRGVQPADLRKRDSFGVLGMQERALVFGGSVTLAGEAGKGTTLRVKIPFMESERENE